eukprot:TRINITY_DN9018_c0_g1_i1.p1 TRINITY_DN9018_c0_g1~~TRINITY_DN9018_c0_g1_i1.p1  ORF type:complete len:1029 (-),score=578.04 TRINITY_DN9018_c0_g1_i1:534-3620(-)
MFLEEIVLDGFKSYASRTVISGFDAAFNAITGLNGSGKSNILDSICFVLGITRLDQVRVSNLQELVYKHGQAGVSKASVTLVFNNDDAAHSPVGYEGCAKITVTRQVVIGGRNKYLLNGHAVQQSRLVNLFHSVQLNVNNPHFLIMQGRITKVINMKPPEMLSMIEEAAGTRMFQEKKHESQRIIERKEQKVDEINRVLAEEITPTLERLRTERTHYMRWTANQQEIERLTRFTVAYEYVQARLKADESGHEAVKLEQRLRQLRDADEEHASNLGRLANEIERLGREREREADSEVRRLDAAVSKAAKELVKAQADWAHVDESVAAESAQLAKLNASLSDGAATRAAKQLEAAAAEQAAQQADADVGQLTQRQNELQQQHQAVQAGLAVDISSSSAVSLQHRLLEAKKAASEAATEAKSCALRIEHAAKELASKRKQAHSASADYNGLLADCQQAEKLLERLRAQLASIDYDPDAELQRAAQLKQHTIDVTQLRQRVETLESQLAGFECAYSMPDKNFDRRRVRGLIARLVRLRQEETALALEVTAGGRLHNVVVDSEQTAQLLTKHVKRRYTFIPLNKIVGRSIEAGAARHAQQLAGPSSSATVARELLSYEPDLEPAINFVFGSTFVCADKETAKRVAYDKQVRGRSVTLDGDVFEPSGTLTGGSRAHAGSVLLQLEQLHAAHDQLEPAEARLRELQQAVGRREKVASEWQAIKQQEQLKAHELDLLRQRLGQTSHQQLLESLSALERQLEADRARQAELVAADKAARLLADQLEAQITNFTAGRDAQLKQLGEQLAAAKKQVQAASKQLKNKQQLAEQLALELQELDADERAVREQIAASEQPLQALRAQLEERAVQLADKKKEHERHKDKLDAKRRQLQAADEQLGALAAQRESLQAQRTDGEVETKKLEQRLQRQHSEKKQAGKFVEHLEHKYAWIKHEQHRFGTANSEYNFEQHEPQLAQRQLSQLHEEQARLAKQINRKVMSMFEKAEAEYQELMAKKQITELEQAWNDQSGFDRGSLPTY